MDIKSSIQPNVISRQTLLVEHNVPRNSETQFFKMWFNRLDWIWFPRLWRQFLIIHSKQWYHSISVGILTMTVSTRQTLSEEEILLHTVPPSSHKRLIQLFILSLICFFQVSIKGMRHALQPSPAPGTEFPCLPAHKFCIYDATADRSHARNCSVL